jgi:hypothetical protein
VRKQRSKRTKPLHTLPIFALFASFASGGVGARCKKHPTVPDYLEIAQRAEVRLRDAIYAKHAESPERCPTGDQERQIRQLTQEGMADHITRLEGMGGPENGHGSNRLCKECLRAAIPTEEA